MQQEVMLGWHYKLTTKVSAFCNWDSVWFLQEFWGSINIKDLFMVRSFIRNIMKLSHKIYFQFAKTFFINCFMHSIPKSSLNNQCLREIVPNFDISMLWPKKWQQLGGTLFIGLKVKARFSLAKGHYFLVALSLVE